MTGSNPPVTASDVLVGAVLAEQHDEWIESRRYIGLEVLAKAQVVGDADNDTKEDLETPLPALTA